mmetsp:Transcript_25266/g.43627  ORF Transcript_25266/g.43627 Transcript_25266/m.43627 type:complete len:384 (+) Transcript_25266:27-1178(+)
MALRQAMFLQRTFRQSALLRTPKEIFPCARWSSASATVASEKRREIIHKPGDSFTRTVTVIPGDGIGREIFESVAEIFNAVNAPIEWDVHEVADGSNRVIQDAVLESLRRNKVGLKGTLSTPIGPKGGRSLNVALRKELDLFAHVVHCFSIPGIPTRHGEMDFTVIRENTEGEYSGMEHEVQHGVVESLKVITRQNSLRIAEYAFEYAYLNNRKRVTAVHKANIMKLCDGLFLKCCHEVSKKYPQIQYDEMIVDNTCMQLVSRPQQFDVMVMPNLYGNVISNIGAGLIGGPGLTPGGNVGYDVAIFEQGARHAGLDIAGKGIANPTGLVLSSVMMLRHLRLPSFADRIERAVLTVVNDGKARTPDVGGDAGTADFTDAVIAHL